MFSGGSRDVSPGLSLRMYDRLNPEAIFLEHLEWIDRLASMACARFGVFGADAEDFAARVRMTLMENDYAILRGFRGSSELKTYLASVVNHHVVSFIRSERGRWRPSAAAARQGPPAAALERLVYRDGYTLQQAGEKLRTAGNTTHSDAELGRLLGRLPERPPLRPVEAADPEKVLDGAPGESRADQRVLAAEAEARHEVVAAALRRVMAQLDPEDRAILRLHYEQGFTLAAVARALDLPQKPLYRRVERLLVRVRALLEGEGIGAGEVRALWSERDEP